MKISKGIYIALCLFLGGAGAHKFYAGKWIQGLLYLAFCWTFIPVILSLVDVIIAICKSPDAQGYIYV